MLPSEPKSHEPPIDGSQVRVVSAHKPALGLYVQNSMLSVAVYWSMYNPSEIALTTWYALLWLKLMSNRTGYGNEILFEGRPDPMSYEKPFGMSSTAFEVRYTPDCTASRNCVESEFMLASTP